MVPRKLVEIAFSSWWLLLLPVILVPALVVFLTPATPVYRSSATIWVANPPGGPTFGYAVSYLTPGQNQTQVLDDLLSTRMFRTAVAEEAGLVPPSASQDLQTLIASEMMVYATTAGPNLVRVTAESLEPPHAQAIVQAVVDNYLERATSESQRATQLEADYYERQLEVAQQELDTSEQALRAYLAENPEAADPTSPESRDLDYQTLVSRVSQQRERVSSLISALQSAEQRLVSLPQSQAAAFSVQDAPLLPKAPLPVSPTKRFGLPLAGMLLGAGISATYLYVRYRTDHTIQSVEDLAEVRVPCLGTVPEIKPRWSLASLNPRRLLDRRGRAEFARRTAASIPAPISQPGVRRG